MKNNVIDLEKYRRRQVLDDLVFPDYTHEVDERVYEFGESSNITTRPLLTFTDGSFVRIDGELFRILPKAPSPI